MSPESDIERRDVLKAVGGTGMAAALTGVGAGSTPTGDTRTVRSANTERVSGDGECGEGVVSQETERSVEEGDYDYQYFKRQLDYPCPIVLVIDHGEIDTEAYVTFDGRKPTPEDYDAYTDGPGEINIDSESVEQGTEVGLLVVVNDIPEDQPDSYYTIFAEQTDEPVSPVAAFEVVTEEPTEGEPVVLDASESFARLGSIESYEWTSLIPFGGQAQSGDEQYQPTGTGSGEQYEFVPDFSSKYRVNLDVVDEYGNSAGAEKYIDVQESDDGFCFITTAAAEERSTLNSLRRFRDGSMRTTPVGRGLVALYYRISPPVARAIERHPEGRTARFCHWYVRRCGALSDRQRALDGRVGSAVLGVIIAVLYILGVVVAAGGYAGIRLSELLR